MSTAMQRAQDAWDHMLPEYDEDGISAEEALEIAIADIESTPEIVADWLQAECSSEDEAYSVDMLAHRDSLTTPQLVALLWAGNDRQALGARYQLLERYRAAMRDLAQERADELIAEGV